MAADETQSLEYKSIPSTYQSVCFVNVDNNIQSIYTGDGYKLPLKSNSSEMWFDSGDISVEDTLYCNSTVNNSNIHTQTGNITSLTVSISATANTDNIDWNNPKSIVTDAAVDKKFEGLQVNLAPLFDSNVTYTVGIDTVVVTLDQPKTIVYVIPCFIDTISGWGSVLQLQAECNQLRSNVVNFSVNSYYEKWRDDADPLRETCTQNGTQNNPCTLIGYAKGNVGENIIQILTLNKRNAEFTIVTANILILCR